jgi:hypothetical protein
MVRDEFPGPASEEILKDLDALAALSLKWASPELMGEPDKKRHLMRRSSGSRQQLVLVDDDTASGALSRQGTAPQGRAGAPVDGTTGTGEGSCQDVTTSPVAGSADVAPACCLQPVLLDYMFPLLFKYSPLGVRWPQQWCW